MGRESDRKSAVGLVVGGSDAFLLAFAMALFGAGVLSPVVAQVASTATQDQGVGSLETWPQWRGPLRDGSQPGDSWPGSLEGLEKRWRVELGKGYPGPIVAADRVFVAETMKGKTEVVRALARDSGEQLWEVSWPGEGSVPFFARSNGDWIRATPAWDGASLYVGGMNEVLVKIDGATGKVRWTIDLPARFGTDIPDFGFASSPLVDDGAVYVQAANSIVKLDAETGETIWRALAASDGMKASGAFSSPMFAEIQGQRQLLVQTRSAIHGVDSENGQVIWSHDVPSFRGMNILTPTVFGNAVFTSSYRNGSYHYAIDRSEGGSGLKASERWTSNAAGYMSSPVVVDGHVYLHLGNERMTCIDLSNGERKWTSEPLSKYASLAVQGDKILMLTDDGELLLVRANPERFELLDSLVVSDQSTWGHIAVAGPDVFVRELEAIQAFRWPGR